MPLIGGAWWLLLFLAVPFPVLHGAAASQLPTDSALRTILENRVARTDGVGIVVGISDSDGTRRVVFAGSAGAGARPLGPGTIFEIGSITKVFTGTLLADMAARGEVSLTDPVQRHLPDRVRMPTRDEREITLHDLATHRSGLPRVPSNLNPAGRTDPYARYTVDQMYEFLSGYEFERDIGSRFEYSNLGVGLLGHALAMAAAQSYGDLVRERILEPLGMESTGVELSGELREWMAQGHNERGRPVPAWTWEGSPIAAAGALRSNVMDMLRFLDANLGEPTSALEVSMRAAHPVGPRSSVPGHAGAFATVQPSIGLNWLISGSDSPIVWHSGGTAGFRSFIAFDPDRRVGVVVLSNSGVSVDDIGFHLLDPATPLAPVVTGSFPGWGVTLLLIGFGAGVFVLEALARSPHIGIRHGG